MKLAANYLQRTGYRLPSEAEWEFACRARTVTRYSFGESEELLEKYACYQKNWQGRLRPVGSLKPNDLGLFDMHGNDWEWCQEEYKAYLKGEDGKATEDNEDQADIADGNWRILRGGVFDPMGYERSAARGGNSPWARIHWNGFRPARTLPFSSIDRYAAARAATLAAAWQKSPLKDATKAQLRRQTLDWLKAELADWIKVRPPVRKLWQWQQDGGLASLRDQSALARLPAAERTAWTQFWADVAKAVEPANNTERLEFARIAVRIAAAQGKDEPGFDDAAKARLRRQALDWLKVVLTATADRAGKASIIAAAEPLPGLLEQLAESAPKDGLFQAEVARHFTQRGNDPLANAARTKARAWFEGELAREPENTALAAELADLLLIDTRWTVLKPAQMKSEGGATLTLLGDRSILAGGVNPNQDVYVIEAEVQGKIGAIRLEAIPDPRMPVGGSGRAPNWGNFVLTDFRVLAGERVVTWSRAHADFSQDMQFGQKRDYSIARAIDADESTGWAIWPRVAEPHWAVFIPSQPITSTDKARLTIRLAFQSRENPRYNLGRFRLSVTEDPAALEREEKRIAALKATDPWLKLAAAYAMHDRHEEASHYFSRALKQANGYEVRKSIIELAARFDEVLSALSKRQPDDPQVQLALARNLAERGTQRLAQKQPAQAQAELEKARAIFARLQGQFPKPQWTVLKPTQMNSQGGATLSLSEDGSILASGTNPPRDEYTLVARPGLKDITAIRLEALPDPSLPHNGPGRGYDGNFHLNKIRVFSGGRPCALTSIIVDHPNMMANGPTPYQQIIHGEVDNTPGWGNYPRAGKSNTATIATRLARAPGDDLKIEMFFSRAGWMGLNLGRFRLAMTNEADAITATEFRKDLSESEVADLHVALAKAHLQQGQTNEAAASLIEALRLATERAGKARIIAEAAPLKGVLEKLTEQAAGDGQFQAELARYHAERGNTPQANAAHTKARALFEKQLAREPENSALAGDLADLLLIDTRRIVLRPAEMKSKGGATLTLLEDGSILSSGKHPERDDYTIKAPVDIKNIGAIALEILPHESLGGNVGRGTAGGFIITEFEVSRLDDSGKEQPVPLKDAVADYEGMWEWEVARHVTDGINDQKGWSTPFNRIPHQLVVKPVQPLVAGTTALTVVIRQNHFNDYHKLGLLLGRFRLSVSSDPAAFEREPKRFVAMKLTDPRLRLLAAYSLIGRNDLASEYIARALQANPRLGDDRQAQYRYNAACAAALTAKGTGRDEPPLDAAAKAKLRGQALDWLTAELTAWSKLVDSRTPQNRLLIVLALSNWQKDSDLASIRDASALAKLPAEEQKGFAQLWTDAAELLKKAEESATYTEYLALARIAHQRRQFTTSAWAWAKALTGEPNLGDNRQLQHRYNAACAAALAAAGQGKDEPQPDDAAKAKLRGQALDWLKAELNTWDRLLAGPTRNGPFIARTLRHWQQDSDLVGLRDNAALDKLPADEKKAWTQLWADVAALLKKAEAGKK
jgi:hypothetical protein